MAVTSPKFSFSSAPKTGCRWMRGVIRSLWPDHRYEGQLHVPQRVSGLPAISFVRDPADWLRSYYQNITGSVHNPRVDVFLKYGDTKIRNEHPLDINCFREFVKKYLEGPAGLIEAAFMSYPADHRWRIEDMPYPLASWIDMELPPSDRMETKVKLAIPHDLRQAIYDHERNLVSTWRY